MSSMGSIATLAEGSASRKPEGKELALEVVGDQEKAPILYNMPIKAAEDKNAALTAIAAISESDS